jgi:hypothetical protein
MSSQNLAEKIAASSLKFWDKALSLRFAIASPLQFAGRAESSPPQP